MVLCMRRVISRDKLATTCDGLRRRGKRIVFTNGCFDLLHPGHMWLLSRCASEGDVLFVAINDDASVRSLKGADRPIYPADERAEILLALRWVDYVTVFPEPTPLETIEQVKPDVLIKGSEYKQDEIVGAEFVKKNGGCVVRIPMKEGHSTRGLVQRMADP